MLVASELIDPSPGRQNLAGQGVRPGGGDIGRADLARRILFLTERFLRRTKAQGTTGGHAQAEFARRQSQNAAAMDADGRSAGLRIQTGAPVRDDTDGYRLRAPMPEPMANLARDFLFGQI